MRDFNRDDRGGDRGGRGFAGRGSGRHSYGGGGDFGRREMHHATCAQCGRDCEVPFRPKEDRPVYCSNCFEKRRSEDGGSRNSGGRDYGRSNYDERRSYSGGTDRGNRGSADLGQLMDQIRSLDAKLDKILNILKPQVIQPQAPEKEVMVFDDEPKEVAEIISPPKKTKAKSAKKKAKVKTAEPESS